MYMVILQSFVSVKDRIPKEHVTCPDFSFKQINLHCKIKLAILLWTPCVVDEFTCPDPACLWLLFSPSICHISMSQAICCKCLGLSFCRNKKPKIVSSLLTCTFYFLCCFTWHFSQADFNTLLRYAFADPHKYSMSK